MALSKHIPSLIASLRARRQATADIITHLTAFYTDLKTTSGRVIRIDEIDSVLSALDKARDDDHQLQLYSNYLESRLGELMRLESLMSTARERDDDMRAFGDQVSAFHASFVDAFGLGRRTDLGRSN